MKHGASSPGIAGQSPSGYTVAGSITRPSWSFFSRTRCRIFAFVSANVAIPTRRHRASRRRRSGAASRLVRTRTGGSKAPPASRPVSAGRREAEGVDQDGEFSVINPDDVAASLEHQCPKCGFQWSGTTKKSAASSGGGRTRRKGAADKVAIDPKVKKKAKKVVPAKKAKKRK